jgi:hypothetical protein
VEKYAMNPGYSLAILRLMAPEEKAEKKQEKEV